MAMIKSTAHYSRNFYDETLMLTAYQKISKLLTRNFFLKLHEYLIMCQNFHAPCLGVIPFWGQGNHIFYSTRRIEDCTRKCVILRLAVLDEEIVKLFVIARSQIKTLQIESLFSSYFDIHGSSFFPSRFSFIFLFPVFEIFTFQCQIFLHRVAHTLIF